MNKIIWLLLIILSIMPIAYAGDIGTVNQSMTLFSDALSAPVYFPTTQANITIRNSTGSIVVNNVSMGQLVQGLYAYNFTPNSTGQYYTITTFANASSVLGSASSTFYVQERAWTVATDMSLTIIFAIGIAAAILLYIAFKVPAQHPFLQFLFIMITLVLLVVLGLAAAENRQTCIVYSNNGAAAQSCLSDTSSSATTLSTILMWTFILVLFYIVAYLLYRWLSGLKDSGKL